MSCQHAHRAIICPQSFCLTECNPRDTSTMPYGALQQPGQRKSQALPASIAQSHQYLVNVFIWQSFVAKIFALSRATHTTRQPSHKSMPDHQSSVKICSRLTHWQEAQAC
eukprot:1160705-Pelagomonas_calceolata.AAC.7